jgi:hypothetical protein
MPSRTGLPGSFLRKQTYRADEHDSAPPDPNFKNDSETQPCLTPP